MNHSMERRKHKYRYASFTAAGENGSRKFDEIYARGIWKEGQEESASGPGSTLSQTTVLRKFLPIVLDELKVGSMIDLPCGDFNWMRLFDWSTRNYLGLDIVKEVIKVNRARYGNDRIRFDVFDVLSGKLPPADLVFCRDLLVHFSFDDIQKALINITRSEVKYLMTTTFPEEPDNEEIQTGDWRPIDLCKAPFDFPKPLMLLKEHCTEADGLFGDKSLGLWRVEELGDIPFVVK